MNPFVISTNPCRPVRTRILVQRSIVCLMGAWISAVGAVRPALQAQEPETKRNSPLAELLLGESAASAEADAWTASAAAEPVEVDEAKVAAHGIRKLTGKHVEIFTDIPKSSGVDQIPRVFDLAVPLWAKYFAIKPSNLQGWKLTGFLIDDKGKFEKAGLLPADLPPFINGYQRSTNFWAYNQPSDYYRRHLVLHEGVHGFMRQFLGGAGASWYSEGIAELLATHKWEFGNLLVGYMPKDKTEVPYWGRIKIIQDEFAASRALMIREVMRLDTRAFLQNDAYAWSWAVAAFLDGHPNYRGKFRRLREKARLSGEQFTAEFEKQIVGQLRELDEQWQLFVVGADYGYDFARNAVSYSAGRPLTSQGGSFDLLANRGWQSTGLYLEGGKPYLITTEGKYVVRKQEPAWVSQANGISIEYVNGRPIGMLLGCVRPDEPRPGVASMNAPFTVGVSRTLTPSASGTLYLKVNDSVGGYADNDGQVTITVKPAGASVSRDKAQEGGQ